jgi:hypothetical protein
MISSGNGTAGANRNVAKHTDIEVMLVVTDAVITAVFPPEFDVVANEYPNE